MSLERPRAIAASVPSTLSARRPADARDWFVRAASCFSDDELNSFEPHADAGVGAASRPTVVAANATRVSSAKRRRSRSWRRALIAKGIVAVPRLRDAGLGRSGVVRHRTGRFGRGPGREGPIGSWQGSYVAPLNRHDRTAPSGMRGLCRTVVGRDRYQSWIAVERRRT